MNVGPSRMSTELVGTRTSSFRVTVTVMQNNSDSNPAPNESFDALIDLLASDDVVEDPRFRNTGQPPVNENLRDPDGRMNLDKIHSFFAGNNQGEPNDSNPSQSNPLNDAKVSEYIIPSLASIQKFHIQDTRSLSPSRDKSPHSAASTPLPGTPYLSRSTATTLAENLLDGDDSFHGPTHSLELSAIRSVCKAIKNSITTLINLCSGEIIHL